MTQLTLAPRGAVRGQRLHRPLSVFVAVLAALALSWQTGHAAAARGLAPTSTHQASPNTAKPKLPLVTIEAKRKLQRQVDHFVTSTVLQPLGDSLARWNTPICPLADGLLGKFNAFIQDRIAQIARSAGVPVAGKQCTANLYVFATSHPDRLLKKLWAHDPWMFETRHGVGGVERFLHSRRPVRVWYNTHEECRNVTSSTASISATGFSQGRGATRGPGNPVNTSSSVFCSSTDSRVSYASLQSISSVFIAVNMTLMKKTTTHQLADYLAMIGLAEVRLNPHASATPTILRLFQHPRRPPIGLSAWDRALLYSLYNTKQSNVLQVADMETTVMRRLMRPRIAAHASSGSPKSAIPRWADEPLRQRDTHAIYWHHLGTQKNDPAAQYDTAVKYAMGQGVPQSYAKAAQWYRKAAKQGYLDAQYNLAVMYANGQGVPQSYAKAAQWYLKAAQQGYADAQFNVGFMYASGQGVPQDYAKGARWYRKAAEQGDADAQHNLAVLYANGEGVPRSYAKAAQWFRKAARQGDAGAQSSLGLDYAAGRGVPRNYAKAAHWFRRAARQGNADAQFDLGILYANGQGVPRDPVSAFKWWLVANSDSNFFDPTHDWSASRMKESASRMSAAQLARAHREASQWLASHRSLP